jgi:hypothetical protein
MIGVSLSHLSGFFGRPALSTFSSARFLSMANSGNKPVSLVLWGHVHRCPMNYRLLNQNIARLEKKRIPLAFYVEDQVGASFEKLHQAVDQQIKLGHIAITVNPSCRSLIKSSPSLSHQYFSMSDRELVIDSVMSLFHNQMPPEMLKHLGEGVFRHFGLLEKLELTKTLIKLKVPYFGIEPEQAVVEKIYQHIYNPALDENDAWLQVQKFRNDFMIDCIYNGVLEQAQKGGVIFVHLGNNHVHRVAAHLEMRFRSMPGQSVKLFPLKLFSPYVMDGIPSHEIGEAATKSLDTAEDQKAYDLVSCRTIICEESVKEKIYGSRELDDIIEDAVEHASEQMPSIVLN